MKKLTEEHKRKIGLANRGHRHSIEVRKKISNKLKGRKPNSGSFKKGKDAPNWKGGITPINAIIRGSLEYRLWHKAVFERDKFTCVWCGAKGSWNKKTKSRIIIHADHIKPFSLFPELRFAIDNGRTLCKSCHESRGLNVGSY